MEQHHAWEIVCAWRAQRRRAAQPRARTRSATRAEAALLQCTHDAQPRRATVPAQGARVHDGEGTVGAKVKNGKREG